MWPSFLWYSSCCVIGWAPAVTGRNNKDNVLLVLTRPPPASCFEWCSFHSAHSSKKPPRSWGSTPSSSQTRMLPRSTAATLPLVAVAALWRPRQNLMDEEQRYPADKKTSVCQPVRLGNCVYVCALYASRRLTAGNRSEGSLTNREEPCVWSKTQSCVRFFFFSGSDWARKCFSLLHPHVSVQILRLSSTFWYLSKKTEHSLTLTYFVMLVESLKSTQWGY